MIEFIWTADDWWIVLTGALAAGACALVGCFLVVRRMSMMGDAISHAVLPGLALAFLITGSRDSTTMFIGAAVIGILTAVLTQIIHRWGRVDEGASMGIVFTTLFAVGLILIVRGAHAVDLDPGCVLYGAIEFVPLNVITIAGVEMPRAAFVLGVFFALNLAFIFILFKELQIASFDPELAKAQGINADVVHYLLMAMVAATTVASFEAVGSILVVAMLIVPAATALLLTRRLAAMLVLSVIMASLASGFGHLAAITLPQLVGAPATNTAGSMALVSGILFAIVVCIAPQRGLISQFVRRFRLRLRIIMEDVLGLLYRLEEQNATGTGRDVITMLREAMSFRAPMIQLALRRLRQRAMIQSDDEGRISLTRRGRSAAQRLVRTHRLWEAYLAHHLQIPIDHLHRPAMELEHYTDQQMREQLAAETGQPEHDPHGQSVPASEPNGPYHNQHAREA